MAFFNWLAWVLRILWACRISVINVVLSLLVFGFAVQAQNLTADLSSMGNLVAEAAFWLGVFAFTFLLWAFPVHYGARRTLDDPAWVLPRALYAELKGRCADEVHAAAADHEILIRWLPRILGLMPFVALALGIYGALGAAPLCCRAGLAGLLHRPAAAKGGDAARAARGQHVRQPGLRDSVAAVPGAGRDRQRAR